MKYLFEKWIFSYKNKYFIQINQLIQLLDVFSKCGKHEYTLKIIS